MRQIFRMLARDVAELSRNPILLALVLIVPPILLLLIGHLNVRPIVTRVAIMIPVAEPNTTAVLHARLRELSSVDWVDWTDDGGDLAGRATREGIDIVIMRASDDWHFFSARTRAGRAVHTQEIAKLLMLSLDRDQRFERRLALLQQLEEKIQHAATTPSSEAAGTDSAIEIVHDIIRAAREEAAIPTPLLSAWLSARMTPFFASASSADHALVPGFISLIAVFVPFVLASTALVREREAGTLAGLLVVTRRNWSILAAGKLLLPVLAGSLAVMLLLVVSLLAFNIGIKPGLASALLTQTLASTVSALIGLTVSSLLESAQEAYASSAVYLVALILLTGMVHPLEQSAPAVVAVAHLFPLTLAAPALEEWMAAGAAAAVQPRAWLGLGIQAVSALVLCTAALLRLKARL